MSQASLLFLNLMLGVAGLLCVFFSWLLKVTGRYRGSFACGLFPCYRRSMKGTRSVVVGGRRSGYTFSSSCLVFMFGFYRNVFLCVVQRRERATLPHAWHVEIRVTKAYAYTNTHSSRERHRGLQLINERNRKRESIAGNEQPSERRLVHGGAWQSSRSDQLPSWA